MKKQGYLKGALIISAGGLISKLLGAIYRIPLVAYIGGEGMGLYQLVYPLYCILLTVSASGIPTGIARLISSNAEPAAERKAFYIYGCIGLIGSLIMFLLSTPLAAAQGEQGVALCCRLLSPSVFFVAVISVVRGYFQGKSNMYPTAFTEVLEQAVKVVFGILLAGLYRGDTVRATAAAVFAVTVSEAISCIFAVILYLNHNHTVKPLFRPKSITPYKLLAYTIPLTFSAIALPVGQLLESIAVVNILRRSAENATVLYGVFSGCAITLINLPVSVTYGLAAASVPQISPLAAQGDIKGAMQRVRKSLAYTAIISLPFAIALCIFAPLAVKIIFPSLELAEKELLIKLVRVMSVNAVTSSLVQTSSACITSLGKPAWGMVTQWSCAVLRVILSSILVAFTPLSITGAAVSSNVCYLVAIILNLCYITFVNNSNGGNKNVDNFNRLRHARRGFNAFG